MGTVKSAKCQQLVEDTPEPEGFAKSCTSVGLAVMQGKQSSTCVRS